MQIHLITWFQSDSSADNGYYENILGIYSTARKAQNAKKKQMIQDLALTPAMLPNLKRMSVEELEAKYQQEKKCWFTEQQLTLDK